MKKSLIALTAATLMSIPLSVSSCTLLAAAGNAVEGGGILFGKTNDVKFPYQCKTMLVTDNGYPYYVLYYNNRKGKFKAQFGVNKYGLGIGAAGPGHLGMEQRAAMKGLKSGVWNYLGKCKTVDEALKMPQLNTAPANIMLVDSKEIACVETFDDDRQRIIRKTNGVLAHTNHYLDPKLFELSKRAISQSSKNRYDRAVALLNDGRVPLTFNDFVAFVNDPKIRRYGRVPKTVETNASMVLLILPNNDFKIQFQYKPDDLANKDVLVELTKKEIFKK